MDSKQVHAIAVNFQDVQHTIVLRSILAAMHASFRPAAGCLTTGWRATIRIGGAGTTATSRVAATGMMVSKIICNTV